MIRHKLYNIISILVLYILLNLCEIVETACPNYCSGHGLCGLGNVCKCDIGWDGGAPDCSSRNICFNFLDYDELKFY